MLRFFVNGFFCTILRMINRQRGGRVCVLVCVFRRVRNGMDLVPRDGAKHYQVILLKETLEMDRVLLALRLGVADIFVHPIDGDLVVDAVERLCKRERVRRRDVLRQSRLRGLSSKLIKDRRVLRQRVDLICNDIVHAYRHLAEKVVDSPDWTPPVEEERPTRERY